VGRNISGLAFDMEGTAFSVEKCHHEGLAHAAGTYGIAVTEWGIIQIPGVIGAGDPGAIAAILKFFGRSDINPEEYRLRKMEKYNELLETAPIALRPGFGAFCAQIPFYLPSAIASLTPQVQAVPLIERTGLGHLFPAQRIILREDVINVKPAPDVFLEAARRLGIYPTELLVFGDSAKDMLAARAAGAIPVGVPYYWIPGVVAEILEAGAAHVFRDWQTINLDGLLAAIAEEE